MFTCFALKAVICIKENKRENKNKGLGGPHCWNNTDESKNGNKNELLIIMGWSFWKSQEKKDGPKLLAAKRFWDLLQGEQESILQWDWIWWSGTMCASKVASFLAFHRTWITLTRMAAIYFIPAESFPLDRDFQIEEAERRIGGWVLTHWNSHSYRDWACAQEKNRWAIESSSWQQMLHMELRKNTNASRKFQLEFC